MSARNEKRAGANGAFLGGADMNGSSIDYHTTPPPSLSINYLYIAGLHGELADYWLDRCKAMLGANDPLFNRAFERVRFFAGLADEFLRRANDVT